jgi:hypothetical protein
VDAKGNLRPGQTEQLLKKDILKAVNILRKIDADPRDPNSYAQASFNEKWSIEDYFASYKIITKDCWS